MVFGICGGFWNQIPVSAKGCCIFLKSPCGLWTFKPEVSLNGQGLVGQEAGEVSHLIYEPQVVYN